MLATWIALKTNHNTHLWGSHFLCVGGGGWPLPCSLLDFPRGGRVIAWGWVSFGEPWFTSGVGIVGGSELPGGAGLLLWGRSSLADWPLAGLEPAFSVLAPCSLALWGNCGVSARPTLCGGCRLPSGRISLIWFVIFECVWPGPALWTKIYTWY